tara:strand:- start:756 stop:1148 length:393 start_codon:yes stop_codon:yes gene_type:complete
LLDKNVDHSIPYYRVINDDKIPALGIGTGWSPPSRFSDRQQRVARDMLATLKLANAAPSPHNIFQDSVLPATPMGRGIRLGHDAAPVLGIYNSISLKCIVQTYRNWTNEISRDVDTVLIRYMLSSSQSYT